MWLRIITSLRLQTQVQSPYKNVYPLTRLDLSGVLQSVAAALRMLLMKLDDLKGVLTFKTPNVAYETGCHYIYLAHSRLSGLSRRCTRVPQRQRPKPHPLLFVWSSFGQTKIREITFYSLVTNTSLQVPSSSTGVQDNLQALYLVCAVPH